LLEVEKIRRVVRQEGPNVGVPMTQVLLGTGSEYAQPQDLLEEVYHVAQTAWVLISGEAPTQVGIGSLTKGLHQLSLKTEVEMSGRRKDPGWFNQVRRWVVDYVVDATFNYKVLRTQDSIRHIVTTHEDVEVALEGFNYWDSQTSASQYVLLTRLDDKDLYRKCFNLVSKFDRARLFTS